MFFQYCIWDRRTIRASFDFPRLCGWLLTINRKKLSKAYLNQVPDNADCWLESPTCWVAPLKSWLIGITYNIRSDAQGLKRHVQRQHFLWSVWEYGSFMAPTIIWQKFSLEADALYFFPLSCTQPSDVHSLMMDGWELDELHHEVAKIPPKWPWARYWGSFQSEGRSTRPWKAGTSMELNYVLVRGNYLLWANTKYQEFL